jgi:hypothetical protein
MEAEALEVLCGPIWNAILPQVVVIVFFTGAAIDLHCYWDAPWTAYAALAPYAEWASVSVRWWWYLNAVILCTGFTTVAGYIAYVPNPCSWVLPAYLVSLLGRKLYLVFLENRGMLPGAIPRRENLYGALLIAVCLTAANVCILFVLVSREQMMIAAYALVYTLSCAVYGPIARDLLIARRLLVEAQK